MNQDDYRRLISGRTRGPAAWLSRRLLAPCAGVYRLVVGLRNYSYSAGLLKVYRTGAAVICVGNITTGGAGKTPLVIWLAGQITGNPKLGISSSECAILTRGYKTGNTGQDEPALLAQSCPGVAVSVNPDRAASAAEAAHKLAAKVLIMDDGFQHRRLARDLDIVAIDAMCPFGYGRILPAGLLREPIASLKRAHAVVITRCDQVGDGQVSAIENKLRCVNPALVIARSIHAPVHAGTADNRRIGLEELKGRRIFAFCGIGNPDAFFGTIRRLGAELVGSKVYDDHYHYTQRDLTEIYALAESSMADFVLTTQKDFTKTVHTKAPGRMPLAYLAVEVRFTAGLDKLKQLIEDTLADKIGAN